MQPVDDNPGTDEPDGETRIIPFDSTRELTNFFLSEKASSRRIRGFPDPPPPPKSFGERIARFFGVDEDQAELKIWRIRHALALQGYLKTEFVPKLPDYETDEVDTVCFRVPVKKQPGGRTIKEEDFKHETGRSFAYRELCRPNPPAKPHVWVMLWLGLLSFFSSVNKWRKDQATQVKEFGFDVSGRFQSLIDDIKDSKDSADGAAEDEETEDKEPLTFFDDRTLPLLPESLGGASGGGDEVDGPASVRSPSKPAMSQHFAARKAEREAANYSGRRGVKGLDRESDKPPRQSDRSKPKFGVISFLLGHRYKTGTIDAGTEAKLSDIYSYRPYFIYWASTVHILVLIVSLATYGFAPVGVGNKVETSLVASLSGGSRSVAREVEQNFWFGPTYTNLIRLGAKYGPCMRRDKRIFDAIAQERTVERDLTACCVRTDSQICFQSTQSECTANFFRWLKWNGNATIIGTGNTTFRIPSFTTPSLVSAAATSTCTDDGTRCFRTSGSVCGQDPVSCQRPASQPPREWPDDISRWPVCAEVDPVLNVTTTSCEVTGRPCCVGKQGVCTIASREHCDYVNGEYHEDKRLCSEVNCLSSICGLTTFANTDTPDQFYRLWTSLCIHVGILHLVFTLLMHMTVGRHIEKLIGTFRMGMIYVLSGIGGNLVSAVFVPYQAEVGPAGALFGLMATLYIEILQQWKTLESPGEELFKLTAVVIFLFVLGLLPYIDNFAHISGFIFGLLLAAIFVPFLEVRPDPKETLSGEHQPNSNRRRKKIIMIAVAAPIVIALFTVLCVVFWEVQDWRCSWCRYLNCVPLTSTICQDLSQDIRQPRFTYNLANITRSPA